MFLLMLEALQLLFTIFPFSAVAVSKPNILFLFTDDQDLELGSLDFLNNVTARIQGQGFSFSNHYATVALCCPSRVALLRGQQAHNTNNTQVSAPGGGYDKWVLSGEDRNYLPHWLKGYHTEYIGKLMNQYGTYNYEDRPKGWDHFDGLLDPYTYIYNTPVFSTNGERPVYYPYYHQTDVLRAKAVDRLEKLLSNSSGQPWFLEVATVAPHQQFNSTGKWPPVPAIRHENLFPGLKAPRSPNFNPLIQKKPSWVGELPYMNEAAIAFSDLTYRRRAQALQGIEELIADLLDRLENAGQLENTVIVFTADHGYHIGNHRVPAGKTLPYREDTHVPLFIRGPGIPKGESTKLPSSHVDIAPTLLTLAGVDESEWPEFFDGRSLTSYFSGNVSSNGTVCSNITYKPETINIEYWGSSITEASGINYTITDSRNTYKTLRIVGEDYGYLYSHWCTNETELYDTITDPYELNPLNLSTHAAIANRMNGILLVTKSCEQNSCRDPWATLHHNGTVHNLAQALDTKYDSFYASLPRVQIKECLSYQLPSNEAPYFPEFVEGTSLGEEYRNSTDGFSESASGDVIIEDGHWGANYTDIATMEKTARILTDEELGINRTIFSDRIVRYLD
ncbi:MAG: hypothetical protein M1834_004473 [Cirrosporium novae-zelandiae]|nr:MAG: hypothetical protein M1834_004473 [Cirrosporium novae-zelandiae]